MPTANVGLGPSIVRALRIPKRGLLVSIVDRLEKFLSDQFQVEVTIPYDTVPCRSESESGFDGEGGDETSDVGSDAGARVGGLKECRRVIKRFEPYDLVVGEGFATGAAETPGGSCSLKKKGSGSVAATPDDEPSADFVEFSDPCEVPGAGFVVDRSFPEGVDLPPGADIKTVSDGLFRGHVQWHPPVGDGGERVGDPEDGDGLVDGCCKAKDGASTFGDEMLKIAVSFPIFGIGNVSVVGELSFSSSLGTTSVVRRCLPGVCGDDLVSAPLRMVYRGNLEVSLKKGTRTEKLDFGPNFQRNDAPRVQGNDLGFRADGKFSDSIQVSANCTELFQAPVKKARKAGPAVGVQMAGGRDARLRAELYMVEGQVRPRDVVSIRAVAIAILRPDKPGILATFNGSLDVPAMSDGSLDMVYDPALLFGPIRVPDGCGEFVRVNISVSGQIGSKERAFVGGKTTMLTLGDTISAPRIRCLVNGGGAIVVSFKVDAECAP